MYGLFKLDTKPHNVKQLAKQMISLSILTPKIRAFFLDWVKSFVRTLPGTLPGLQPRRRLSAGSRLPAVPNYSSL